MRSASPPIYYYGVRVVLYVIPRGKRKAKGSSPYHQGFSLLREGKADTALRRQLQVTPDTYTISLVILSRGLKPRFRMELGRDVETSGYGGGIWARARSPSASPPPSRVLPHDSSEHIFIKQTVADHSWAYFSVRPPSSPMRLVPALGRTVAVLPPPPLIRTNQNSRAPVASEVEKCNDIRQQEIQQFALQLFDELLGGIPPHCCAFEFRADNAAEKAPHHEEATPVVRATSYKNVAVQALTRKKKANAVKETNSCEACGGSSVTGADGAGWLGDARALRDEHVRLIRHQLRHIVRLNRALDRAARPPHDNTGALDSAAARTMTHGE